MKQGLSTVATRTIRVCGYVRVSTRNQVQEGNSLEEQEGAIQRYCTENEYELADLYIDAGISGRKVHRPEFNKMLEAIREGRYDQVVVWRLDRAARKPSIGYKLKDALDLTGTEIRSITEPYIQNRFMYGIVLSMAEEEAEKKSERAMMGAAARAKRGMLSGALRYGFKLGADGKPEIDEGEAGVVRRLFSEYVGGVGPWEIADRFEADGVATRHGKRWYPENLTKLIAATEYIGWGYFMRRHSRIVDAGDRDVSQSIWRDEKDWIQINYPPIVEQSVWEQAQVVRKQNGRLRARRGYALEYALRHLVWCASCGARFTAHATAGLVQRRQADGSLARVKTGKQTRSYVCTDGRHGRLGCVRPRIGAIKLEALVWAEVQAVIENPGTVKALIEERRAELERTGTLAEADRIGKAIEDIDGERKRAITAFTKGYVDDGELDVRMKGINERREMHEVELSRLKADVDDYERQRDMLDDFVEVSGRVRDRLDNLTHAERTELMRAMVTKVVVGADIQVAMAISGARVNGEAAP